MKRTYAHRVDLVNPGKQQQLLQLFPAFHRALGTLQAYVRQSIFQGEDIPKYVELPGNKRVGGLSARQMKSVGNMVKTGYLSWQALVEHKVRNLISCSPVEDYDRTVLYRVNKHHMWFKKTPYLYWQLVDGILIPAKKKQQHAFALPVSQRLLKLLRCIVKHVMKTCHMPDLRRVNTLVLDSIIAKVERPQSTQSSISFWINISTLAKGHPVQVPLLKNPYFERAYRNTLKQGGKLCGVIQLTREQNRIKKISLITETPVDEEQQSKRNNDHTVGIDYGFADALLATSDGQLLGQRVYRKIKQWDDELVSRHKWCQKRGIKPSTDKRYTKLQQRIKNFVTNEIGRLLNQLARRDGDAAVQELVVEHLDFRYGGMSKQMNRLITRIGRKIFKTRLAALSEKHGITVTEVASQYTSQECSGCGYTDKKNRKTRSKFVCQFCGKKVHADMNAARVILSRRSWQQPDTTGFLSRRHTLDQLDMRFQQQWNHLPSGRAVPNMTGASGDPNLHPVGRIGSEPVKYHVMV